ncbi:MAG: hypothetical protein M1812_002507 [Candelaria pacifica]|nr:MAG: hypothetical protein M1812_002507 [Candelaria pacifica]
MANLHRNVSLRGESKLKPGNRGRKTKTTKSFQGDQRSVANINHTGTVLPDAPTVDELRRVRADYYSKGPEERRRVATAGMVYVSEMRSNVVRRESMSKTDGRNHSGERRHKHRSNRNHRSRKDKHDDKAEASTYVYGNPNDEDISATEETSNITLQPRVAREASSRQSRARARTAGRSSVSESMDLRSQRGNRQRRSSDGSYREVPLRYVAQNSDVSDSHSVAPSHKSKSRSNRYTATVEELRAPKIIRSSTTRDPPSTQASRPQLRRSNTTTRAHPSPSTSSSVRPSLPSKRPVSYATPSVSDVLEDKEASVGNLKPSPPRNSIFTPISVLFGRRGSVGPVKKIECLTCLSDDVPITKSAKLSCGHRMCHDCLKRIFTMSVSDPQHMPPKCCTQDHIPLQHVDKLFGDAFKIKWNKKYQEYTTKNRIYCPSRGCGEWIRPANIHLDTSGGATGGRKYGKCGRCKTKVCCLCNGKWHTGKTCPKDEETKQFIEIAKKEGWQRCYNCSAMVELKEGCNHMTCRCTAEFCIICAKKWKTCDCPWFNYDAVENDRLNHMNVPRPVPVRPAPDNGAPERPRGYNDELARRRLQELRDEAMARRLQTLGIDDDDDDRVVEPGNPRHQFINQDYVRAAADILTGPYAGAEAAANRLPNRRPPANDPHARAREERGAALLRQHTAESDLYNNAPHRRASERVVPRRIHTDINTEYERHQPLPHRTVSYRGQTGLQVEETPRRSSELAGLVTEREGGRVGNWLEYVEDDDDDD